MKLARVISVQEPTQFMYRRVKTRCCGCVVKDQPDTLVEVKQNCLKVFKNQVNYSTKLGTSLYYDVFDDFEDTHCWLCNCKYSVAETKFARCQKTQIVALLPYVKGVVDLTRQTQTCWLIDPFMGSVAVGDVINLTAFYYMSPQQQMVNGRCVSQLAGSFVAFDITKVNPFN